MQKKKGIAGEETIYQGAIYIRLSKEDGDKQESNSITNQRELIYGFLKNKPDIQVCRERVDDGYSGINFDRPGIKQLLEEVKAGEINCIIVKDLSRFGRNYIETGRYIQQIFPFLGVRFIAINNGYDSARLESRADNIILPFRNLMNDSYCRDISIKVRSQIEVRQRKGDYIGSFPVYGYFRDKEHKGRLIIDETAAAVVRDIFAMKIAGKNHKRIADYLNEWGVPSPMEYKALLNWRYSTSFKLKPKAKWSAMAVERILKNEIYTGTMVQGKEKTLNYKVKKRIKVAKEDWIRVEDTHEPVISKEDFTLVQKLLLWDTRTSPKEQEVYLFAGLLYCGDCNEAMVRKKQRTGKKEYTYYMCSGNKKDKTVCNSHRIKENDLKEIVLKMLRIHVFLVCSLEGLLKAIKDLPLQEHEVKKRQGQLERRKEELLRIQKLKLSLYEDYKEGLLTKKDYMEMREDYETVCLEMEEAIRLLEEEIDSFVQGQSSHNNWIDHFKRAGNVTELSRSLLILTIDKILVFDNGIIRIHFRYQNEFAAAVRSLEEIAAEASNKSGMSEREHKALQSFLAAAREA